MKLEFMGTGSIGSKRFNACLLINDCILIDAPPGVVKHLIQNKFNLGKLSAIFITHQHADHYFDLPIIIQQLVEKNIKKIDIFCNQSIKESFNTMIKLAFPDVYQDFLNKININFTILEQNKKYNYKELQFTAIPTKHGDLNQCFSFMISSSNILVGYSGDTYYTNEIQYLCKECNHLILDCTKQIGDNEHMGIDNILNICNQYPDKIIYINHIGKDIDNIIQKSNNLIIPNDGDIYYLN